MDDIYPITCICPITGYDRPFRFQHACLFALLNHHLTQRCAQRRARRGACALPCAQPTHSRGRPSADRVSSWFESASGVLRLPWHWALEGRELVGYLRDKCASAAATAESDVRQLRAGPLPRFIIYSQIPGKVTFYRSNATNSWVCIVSLSRILNSCNRTRRLFTDLSLLTLSRTRSGISV